MTPPHESEHSRVVRRVACGELSLDDEQVRQLAVTCATCKLELEELGSVLRTLSEWSQAEHEQLDGALASIQDEDFKLVKRLAPKRPGQTNRRRTGWKLLAAAAVVAFATLASRDREADDVDSRSYLLGDSAAECSRPVGFVENYDEFVWDWSRLADESFTLVIWNSGDANPVVRVPRLKTSGWTPSPMQKMALRERIRWEVRKLGTGGEFVDSIQAWASRSH